MRIALGDPVVAWLPAPAAPLPNYGARIEVPYTRAIASYWQPAVVNDTGDELQYVVTLEAPVGVGDYVIVWRSGNPDPNPEVFIPLMVVTTAQFPILT